MYCSDDLDDLKIQLISGNFSYPKIDSLFSNSKNQEAIKMFAKYTSIGFASNYDFFSCLISVIFGDMEAISLLIERGVDFKQNKAANRLVCKKGYYDIVKIIFDAIGDEDGELFRIACLSGHIEIVKLLYNKSTFKANNVFDHVFSNGNLEVAKFLAEKEPWICKQYESNLLSTIKSGRNDIARLLIENGADPNLVSLEDNDDCLTYAVAEKNMEMVEYLLNHGADINKAMNIITPIVVACENGDVEMVKYLLGKGARATQSGYELTEAAKRGNVELITLLLENGGEVNALNCFIKTALFAATENNRLEAVKLLIKSGADVNKDPTRPLLTVASKGYLDIVKLLIENGAIVDEDYLAESIKDGHTEVVRVIIDNGIDINQVRWSKGSPLERAFAVGSRDLAANLFDIIKLLIEKGADVSMFGPRATEKACAKGSLEVVRFMVEELGVNLDENDIIRAISNGHLAVVNYLIDKVRISKRQKALRCACASGVVRTVELILESGCDARGDVRAALKQAARSGSIDIIRLLMLKGANISKYGSEALVEACTEGYVQIVKLLIRAGADVNAMSGNKKFPLDEACLNGNKEIVRILLENGASVEPRDGKCPLYSACLKGFYDIAELLALRMDDREAIANSLIVLMSETGNSRAISLLKKILSKYKYDRVFKGCKLDLRNWNNDLDVLCMLCQNGARIKDDSEKYISVNRWRLIFMLGIERTFCKFGELPNFMSG